MVGRLIGVMAMVVAVNHAVAAAGPQSPVTSAPAAPPRAVCIAIGLPAVEGIEGDASAFAASARTLFISYLTGPTLKALPLEARLPSQAAEEARQKDCARVLSVTLVRKHGVGHALASAITAAVSTAAAYIPTSSATGAIAVGTAVAGAEAVGRAARSTRATDELRIDYRLTSPHGASILPLKSEKAKAKTDGEDLVTPLVARAAEVIAAAVARK